MKKFEDLRVSIKSTILGAELESILLDIVNELEKVHNEIRQGFTKPE